MGNHIATLKPIRYVLFGDENGPGPNAPCIGDTLWAGPALTLQDYIDSAIERDETAELPLFHFEQEPMTQADAEAYRIEMAERPCRPLKDTGNE